MLKHRVSRVLLVAIALCIGVASGLQAWASVTARSAPRTALAVDSGNPDALVALADQEILQSAGKNLQPAALSGSARRALERAPLNAAALRQLGLAAESAGNLGVARRLMIAGTKVSRRDLFTHLWMIEDRAAAGDIRGALDQYDIALTTSDRALALLFPTLASALEEPQIRAGLLPLIDKQRPWMVDFLAYAVKQAKRPQDVAQLFIAHRGLPRTPAYQALEPQLVRRLVEDGQYEAAMRYARSVRGFTASVLDNIGLTVSTTDSNFAPLTWQLADQPEIRAEPAGGGGLAVTVSSSAGGTAATRVVALAPGRYAFSQLLTPVAQYEAPSLIWQLECLLPVGPGPIWRQSFSAGSARPQSAVIDVPAGCRVQRLTLIATGADTQSDTRINIRALTIARTR